MPHEKSSVYPKLCDLLKVNKPNSPLRPIGSSIGSLTQKLAKYFSEQLQPFAEEVLSYLKKL